MPRSNPNTFEFKFGGKGGLTGVAVTVCAVLFIAFRAFTIGESSDDRLYAMVKAELMNDVGGNTSRALDNLDTDDPGAVEEIIAMSNSDAIEIHSITVSKPFLSMSSNEDIIIHVDYTLPEAQRTQEYWRVRRSLSSGWQYRGRSSAISYYLNFM